MKYYRLMDELYIPEDRWFLKGINLVDENRISVWKFVSPEKVVLPDGEKIKISVREHGRPLDFTFADFSVLIVNERVASLLEDRECQLIPINVEGIENKHRYFVAILLISIDCLDEQKSIFEKWEKDDPIRPDLAGEYKGIYKLIVDPSKIGNYSIFRLAKYDNAIIVSEKVKKQFEKNGISGIKFRIVT